MSYGKMNTFIKLISTEPQKDAEGFVNQGDTIVSSVRAYKEERHGNEAWKNRASFSTASALFRFRKVPGVQIKTDMVISCDSGRYNIVSVEDVKDRQMYIEVLCEKVVPSG
jgi:head-tail adaptor